jgi:hypothetical protein
MLHIAFVQSNIHFRVGLVVYGATGNRPPSIRVQLYWNHLMQHARVKRLGNQLGGSHPFYKSGYEPSAVNGRFHQLENLVDHRISSSSPRSF